MLEPFLSLSTGTKSLFSGVEDAASKTQRGLPGIAFSNSWWEACNNLSFILVGMSWLAHDDGLPKICNDVEEF